MHDNVVQIEMRISNVVRDHIAPALFRRFEPVTIAAWEVPDEPVPFAVAVGQEYSPFSVGQTWSKPWGTTWFMIDGTVPLGWRSDGTAVQLLVDLGFSPLLPAFQAEGLVFTPDGTVVKGLEPFNHVVDIDALPGESVRLFVEAASNPNMLEHFFANTLASAAGGPALPSNFARPRRNNVVHFGDKKTAGIDPIYTLRRVALVERDLMVDALLSDVGTLLGLMYQLGAATPRRAEILRALEDMADVLDPDDVAGTAQQARAALAAVLAAPAHVSAHSIVAVGHAHLDSAWLWPTRETVRKTARTFSNVLDLMDEDPDFVFVASSAQQFAWTKEFYPELFERIRARAIEGRFILVGGMWVESDTNMPGGEALVRQFLYGQAFFEAEFGAVSREGWLPDSFGFTSALPQIAVGAGLDSFLTQKMSWNDTNRMPHHTFLWEGLDGSRIFTHFPPNDTYGSDLGAEDLAKSERQFAEKGLLNTSITLFGFSDGGGGPTRDMLAAAHRAHDLEGSPRVRLGSPAEFFQEAKAALARPEVWSGEMYLEAHRGTLTSQARTKAGNRRSEHLLREAELWSATAALRGLIEYPYAELDAAWHTVLLQQFHDILPGSAIAWVHDEAEEHYRVVAEELEAIILRAIRALAGEGESRVAFNAAPFAADSVAPLGAAAKGVDESPVCVKPIRIDDSIVLENTRITARFDSVGLLVSVVDREVGRDLLAPGEVGSLLQVFRDKPNMFEAWDIDRSYLRSVSDLRAPTSVELEADAVVVVHEYGNSRIVQRFRLPESSLALHIETNVDWHEQEKLLKLGFPLDVRTEYASSEIQFGHVLRPTFVNTSWDAARFETVAHRWVHVGEPGFGAVVANATTYGHDITRHVRDDGGTTTVVRQSLLRAPVFPDPESDQGEHVFQTLLGIAPTVIDAARSGYHLNLPLRVIDGSADAASLPIVEVSSRSVLVEAVKLAHDRSGDLIVRLYEAEGARASATVTVGRAFDRAWTTNLLEQDLAASTWGGSDAVALELRPFEIVTLRIRMR
jgi:alpha-mannosidase